MINKPWVPFPDYEDHVTVSQPLFTISPEVEVRRAEFAQKIALSLLLGLSDVTTSPTDRGKMALHLAKLSARVLCRRKVITTVLDSEPDEIPDELLGYLEVAVHSYWIVAQMANLLIQIPQHKDVLAWTISQAIAPLPVTEGGRIRLPWRSDRLADAMYKHYRTREAFMVKLWDSRFPVWMQITSKLATNQKTGFFGPKDMKGNS